MLSQGNFHPGYIVLEKSVGTLKSNHKRREQREVTGLRESTVTGRPRVKNGLIATGIRTIWAVNTVDYGVLKCHLSATAQAQWASEEGRGA